LHRDGENIVRRDVHQANPMTGTRPPDEGRRLLAVDDQRGLGDEHVRRGRIETAAAEHHAVVDRWVVCVARFNDNQRAVEAQRQLTFVVHVRVVHERAGPWRREPDQERAARFDHRRQTLIHSAPVVDAVVIALELHAVPVKRGSLSELVDDRDFNRFAPPQEKNRAWRDDVRRRR
jgi:hypothetical protein